MFMLMVARKVIKLDYRNIAAAQNKRRMCWC